MKTIKLTNREIKWMKRQVEEGLEANAIHEKFKLIGYKDLRKSTKALKNLLKKLN
jgi:hypothetical protein